MRAPDSTVVTVKVPFVVRKRRGRRLVLAPDGAPMPPATPHIDSTLVKAIARAFRWRKLMETGAYGTIEELAAAEKINSSYVSRILRLALLAPPTIEAILNSRHPPKLKLANIMKPFPVLCSEQRNQ